MRNGQLKLGYNLQIADNSEYIAGCYCSSDRDDVNTLVPFLDKMKAELPEKYQNIVADSGYESEENYMYLEQNKQTSYIKPTNYEISKTAKYIKDKSKRENSNITPRRIITFAETKNGLNLNMTLKKSPRAATFKQ